MGKKAIALRIDEQLWKQLQRWANAELRSINGQIEYLLREAVRHRRGETKEALPALEDQGEGSGAE